MFLDLSLQTQMETTEAETTQVHYLSTGLKYVLDQVRTQMETCLMCSWGTFCMLVSSS